MALAEWRVQHETQERFIAIRITASETEAAREFVVVSVPERHSRAKKLPSIFREGKLLKFGGPARWILPAHRKLFGYPLRQTDRSAEWPQKESERVTIGWMSEYTLDTP